jgi:nucleoside-diphosphate-sugar epimerase
MGSPIKLEIDALPYRPGETMHFYCSNEKARKILGWGPNVPLEAGLKRTIDWYKESLS